MKNIFKTPELNINNLYSIMLDMNGDVGFVPYQGFNKEVLESLSLTKMVRVNGEDNNRKSMHVEIKKFANKMTLEYFHQDNLLPEVYTVREGDPNLIEVSLAEMTPENKLSATLTFLHEYGVNTESADVRKMVDFVSEHFGVISSPITYQGFKSILYIDHYDADCMVVKVKFTTTDVVVKELHVNLDVADILSACATTIFEDIVNLLIEGDTAEQTLGKVFKGCDLNLCRYAQPHLGFPYPIIASYVGDETIAFHELSATAGNKIMIKYDRVTKSFLQLNASGTLGIYEEHCVGAELNKHYHLV